MKGLFNLPSNCSESMIDNDMGLDDYELLSLLGLDDWPDEQDPANRSFYKGLADGSLIQQAIMQRSLDY